MKKSQLRKIIRESIKGLITEDPQPPYNSHRRIKMEICESQGSPYYNVGDISWYYHSMYPNIGFQCDGLLCSTNDINKEFETTLGLGTFTVKFKLLDFQLPIQCPNQNIGTTAGECRQMTPASCGPEERGCMDPNALNDGECCPGNNYSGCVPNIPNNEECCEYEGRGTEDKGCMDPNALNNGECCNGDPNCTAIYPNPECCRYEDDPVEEIYCECCKGQYAQSMAQTVSSPADCIGAENTVYAGMGVYGCNVSPVSGGPGTQCKKPLPTDPRGPIAESIIRMQKLANITKK